MTQYGEAQQQHAFASALRTATPRAYFTWILVALNVAVFLAMGVAGVGWFTQDTAKVLNWGADFWPYTTAGQWWRLLTSAFIHFGVIHIAMNMWALVSVGNLTERLFGNFFFLLVYLFSAVLSSLIAVWWDLGTVEAGASGAVFGVFGATLAYLLFQNDSFPKVTSKPLMSSMMTCVAFNIYFGLTNKHISNSAHIGGLVSGFVLGAIVCRPLDLQRRSRQTLPRILAGIVIAFGLVAAGIHLIPKSHVDPQNEAAFEVAAANSRVSTIAVDKKYNEIVEQQQKLPHSEIANRLDQEVIPELNRIVSELAKMPLKDATTTKANRDLWIRFLETRRDAIHAWGLALRASSREDIAKEMENHKRLLKISEDLQRELDQPVSNLPGK